MKSVAKQFWVVDANSTALVTPRVLLLPDCACGTSLHGDNIGNNFHDSWPTNDEKNENIFHQTFAQDTEENVETVRSWPVRMNGIYDVDESRHNDPVERDNEPLFNDYHKLTFASLYHSSQLSLPTDGCRRGYCHNGGKCIEKFSKPV